MKPGLRGVFTRTVESLRADERVVAAYNTGSVGTEREDEYSDVDPMFVVRAAEFEGLDRDLKGVFAAAGVTPILWWPERGNCDTLRNYAIMFEHEGELLQYDINIQAWEDGVIPVRPGSVLFDKAGVLAEAGPVPALAYDASRLGWMVEIYWIYVYIHGKYLRRGDPFRLAAGQRELFDAHLSILHALHPEVPFDWWPILAPRVADEAGQEALLSYLEAGDARSVAARLAGQLDRFAADARAACAKWEVPYPDVFEAAVRRYVAHILTRLGS